MPFKFRLERILKLRRDELETARQVLAEALAELAKARKALTQAQNALREAKEEMIKDNYKMPQEYLRLVKDRDKKVEKREIELENAEAFMRKARENAIEAQQKVEVLEKLKEKQTEEYKNEENRIDQIQTNEKVTLKYASEVQKQANNEEDS